MATSTELVRSVAKIEQNQNLNGSQNRLFDKNWKTIPAKDEALRDEVSALTFVSPLAYKMIIDLRDLRVTESKMQSMDKNLRVTKGLYMIKYIPKSSKKYKKGRPWVIGQDLIRMGIYVSGWTHWNYLCDRIPELDWLRRNSTLTKKMFDYAAMQPGMSFWFTIDWPRYVAKLATQPGPAFGSKQGTESSPFASYKCSGKEYRKHYKDKCATLRVLNDVLKEVQEVEALPSVQKEMLDATGESGVTRKDNVQPKDTKTGRFVSRKKEE